MSKVRKKFYKLNDYYERKEEIEDLIIDSPPHYHNYCNFIPEYVELQDKIKSLQNELEKEIEKFIKSTYEYKVHTIYFCGLNVSKPKLDVSIRYGSFSLGITKMNFGEEDSLNLKLKCFTGFKFRVYDTNLFGSSLR